MSLHHFFLFSFCHFAFSVFSTFSTLGTEGVEWLNSCVVLSCWPGLTHCNILVLHTCMGKHKEHLSSIVCTHSRQMHLFTCILPHHPCQGCGCLLPYIHGLICFEITVQDQWGKMGPDCQTGADLVCVQGTLQDVAMGLLFKHSHSKKKNKKCLSFRDLEVASCILLLQYRSHTSMSKTPSEETDRGSLYSGAMAGQFWLGSSRGTVLPEGCKAKVSFIAKCPTTPEK